MKAMLPVMTVVLISACGGGNKNDSKCDKYGRMEAKCSDIPDDERADTVTVAKAFCLSAHADKDKDDLLNIKAEAQCALVHTDCKSYKACAEAAEKKKSDKMMKEFQDELDDISEKSKKELDDIVKNANGELDQLPKKADEPASKK